MTSTPDTAARSHRARRGEGELLRDELLDAAEQLLLEHGHPDRVSMRAIATRVGVTAASIYLHFTDKDELFFATCERRFNDLSAEVVTALTGTVDTRSRLLALGRAYVRWGIRNREHYAVIMGGTVELPSGVDVTSLSGRRAFTVLLEVIAEGMAAGELRVDITPEEAAIHLWAAVHGYVSLVTTKQAFVPEVDLAGAEDAVLDAALRALVAAPSP